MTQRPDSPLKSYRVHTTFQFKCAVQPRWGIAVNLRNYLPIYQSYISFQTYRIELSFRTFGLTQKYQKVKAFEKFG